MEGGYNFEVSSDEIPEMRCQICLQLLRKATEMPCSHFSCRVCLQTLEDEQNVA